MAFENVNVYALRNSLISARDSLNHSQSDTLVNDIMKTEVWYSDSRNTLRGGIEKIINANNDLEALLNRYINVTYKIEEYKNLQNRNSELRGEYHSIEPNLYHDEEYDETSYDPITKTYITNTYSRRVMDYGIANRMDAINHEIEQNNRRMESIYNEVNNSV